MPPPPFDGTGVPVPGPPDAELLFNVDIEPDADRDGFGDETRDRCPQRADALNRPCVLGFGLRAEPPQTAVIGQEAALSFQVTPTTGLRVQPPPVSEPVSVSVAVPPGFRVLRATAGGFNRCEITSTTVTCPNTRVGPNGLVELTGIPSGTFYDRAGSLPWSLEFRASAWSSMIDAHPEDNSAIAQLRLKDGTCTVNLVARGDKRRNRIRGTMFGDRIAGAAGADRLAGRSGRDCIRGGDGADVISGGPGRDRLNGSDGKDRIDARDGVRDLVACGPGKDLAVVDRKDRVGGCERVRRR
jgi:RTX calcium-binding nonapeptide repeat (4 copies)